MKKINDGYARISTDEEAQKIIGVSLYLPVVNIPNGKEAK